MALVTGGARGIGRAIADAFVDAGAAVAVVARSAEQVDQATVELRARGGRALGLVADVSVAGDVDRLIERTTAELGAPDVLVNNAGVQGPIGPLAGSDAESWVRAIEINLIGCYLCSRAVLSTMIARRRGKIVNLSGGGATGSRPFFTAYAAAKTAVVRLTECLADEVREHNVQVNAIAPGAANTALTQEVLRAGAAAGSRDTAEARDVVATGGVDLTVPAALAVFLASPASDGLTGRLVAAQWDDWRGWAADPVRIVRIMAGDGGRLRRIKPEDGDS